MESRFVFLLVPFYTRDFDKVVQSTVAISHENYRNNRLTFTHGLSPEKFIVQAIATTLARKQSFPDQLGGFKKISSQRDLAVNLGLPLHHHPGCNALYYAGTATSYKYDQGVKLEQHIEKLYQDAGQEKFYATHKKPILNLVGVWQQKLKERGFTNILLVSVPFTKVDELTYPEIWKALLQYRCHT